MSNYSTIFSIGRNNKDEQHIDLDELYDKKQKADLKKLELYTKILNGVYAKIKKIASSTNDRYYLYNVPLFIQGIYYYDHSACLAFLLNKLQKNKFVVQFINPNQLFISWNHWIPRYVRDEIIKNIKETTGEIVEINEIGEFINPATVSEKTHNYMREILNPTAGDAEAEADKKKPKKQYKPLSEYKQIGIYSSDMFESLAKKIE